MYAWNPTVHSTPLDRPMRHRDGLPDVSAIPGSPDRTASSPVKREPASPSLLLRPTSRQPVSDSPNYLHRETSPSSPHNAKTVLMTTARSPGATLLVPRSEEELDHGLPFGTEGDSFGRLSFSTRERADLEHANVCLEECIRKDFAKVDIAEQLVVTGAGLAQVPSAGGAHPDDYIAGDVAHFKVAQTYPVANEITQAVTESTSGFSSMGSFPEIRQAWAAVDTNLYIWSWENSKKVTTVVYPEFVTAVDLLPTSATGLMHFGCPFVVVASTVTEILFSSVKISGSSYAVDTDSFCLRTSTNDQRFCRIQCTKQGRVFLGSIEGQVCELQNIKQGLLSKFVWFGPRLANCTLAVYERIASALPGFHLFFRKEPITRMILDDSRKILYTLRKDNNVDLYDLGMDGNAGVRHVHLSFQSVASQALPLLRNVDRLQIKQIISVHPIDPWESSRYPFFLLTSAGLRLYFGVRSQDSNGRPREFLLSHIRFPPGHNPSAPVAQITSHLNVSSSCYVDGTLTMVVPDDQEDQDNIVSCSNDLYIYEEKYRESVTAAPIQYHIEAITQLQQFQDDSLALKSRSLALNQLLTSRKTLVVLTAKKIYLLEKSYPVDILEKMLRTHSPGSAPMREFIGSLPPFQGCFLALHLACVTNSGEIARLATKILTSYPDEPTIEGESPVTSTGRMRGSTQPQPTNQRAVLYSAKHDAFYYLVARIVGPLWIIHPFLFGAEYKGSIAWITGIPASDIPHFIEQLTYVKRYLDSKWKEMFYPRRHGLQSEEAITRMNAAQVELSSIRSLSGIIEGTIQLLKLWDFLLREGLTQVLDYVCRAFSKETLMQLTFPDLLVSPTGQAVVDAIIKAIHQRYLDEGADTESILKISAAIQELCPKLFDTDDAVTLKVLTMIDKAKTSPDSTGALALLDSALNYIRPNATVLGLREILDKLSENHFYEAAVELCCLAALQCDPQNYAIRYVINNEPMSDNQGKAALDRRHRYYQIVAKILSDLDTAASTVGGAVGKQTRPAEMRSKLESILEWMYTNSADVLLHFSVFEWCFNMQLDRYAMASGSPYLKDFLFRKIASFSATDVEASVRYLKLIVECCERTGDKWTAARALYQLALHDTAQIHIVERVDYLARIELLCQTLELRGSVPELMEFHSTVKRNHALASVQKDVFSRLDEKAFDVTIMPDLLSRVMYELFDANKLFQLTDEANMPQWSLVILSMCGEKANPKIIMHAWGRFFQNALDYGRRHRAARDACVCYISEEVTKVRSHLSPSDPYCSLEVVLEGFEKKYAAMGKLAVDDPVFVFDCVIQSVGYDLMDVIEMYHKLFYEKYTADPVISPHLLRVHIFMANSAIDNSLPRIGSRERRKMIQSHYHRSFDEYMKVAMRLQLADEDILVEMQNTSRRLATVVVNGRSH